MDYGDILKDKERLKILARVVAHLMGDGCVTERYFAYYNQDKTLLNVFEKDVSDLFGKIHFTRGKTNSGTSLLMVQNKPIRLFLKSLTKNYKSHYLEIPDFIKGKESQKEFLRAFYDDEGCVALRVFKKTGEIKRNITLSSNS